MVSCHHCATLWKDVKAHDHCGRCGARLHARKPDSLNRTWALLIAACIMYVPANLLPVMTTASLFEEKQDTIMSGIIYFWVSGSWILALIVFIASFLVPLFKLAALILLLIMVQRRSSWGLLQRAKLYRIVEVDWPLVDARCFCRNAADRTRTDQRFRHGIRWARYRCFRRSGGTDHACFHQF